MSRIIRFARFIRKDHALLFLAAFGVLGYVAGLVLIFAHLTPVAFPASVTHAAYGVTVLGAPFALLFTLYIVIHLRETRRAS